MTFNWHDLLIQLGLAAFGLAGLYLSMVSQSPKLRKLAPYVGVCGQPFWLYSTWNKSLYGMFFICCCYTAVYLAAILRNSARLSALTLSIQQRIRQTLQHWRFFA